MNILLAKIDDNMNSSTTFIHGVVLERIDIISIMNCDPEFTSDSVCCHSERINTSLPAEMNAFGVLFPDQILLEYNDSQYQAQTFVTSDVEFVGIDDTGRPLVEIAGYYTTSLSLRFLRFNIQFGEVDLPIQSPDSSSDNNIHMILAATSCYALDRSTTDYNHSSPCHKVT
jgi:hypothetical protein